MAVLARRPPDQEQPSHRRLSNLHRCQWSHGRFQKEYPSTGIHNCYVHHNRNPAAAGSDGVLGRATDMRDGAALPKTIAHDHSCRGSDRPWCGGSRLWWARTGAPSAPRQGAPATGPVPVPVRLGAGRMAGGASLVLSATSSSPCLANSRQAISVEVQAERCHSQCAGCWRCSRGRSLSCAGSSAASGTLGSLAASPAGAAIRRRTRRIGSATEYSTMTRGVGRLGAGARSVALEQGDAGHRNSIRSTAA